MQHASEENPLNAQLKRTDGFGDLAMNTCGILLRVLSYRVWGWRPHTCDRGSTKKKN